MSTRSSLSLADAIQEVVRPLVAATPPPRALPFLGIDHPSGTSLRLLERLAAHGIFRKYEQVLDLGTRFGAVSRWIAGRLGGDAVAATATADDAIAARQLTHRTGLRQQVRCVAVDAARLPFADARFTHVWAVEPSDPFVAPAGLREAARVVRPGGWFALQRIVAGRDVAAIRSALMAAVAGAGFFEIVGDDVSDDALERAAQLIAAREQLERRLAAQDDAGVAWVAASAAVRARLAAGDARVLQVVARRPA